MAEESVRLTHGRVHLTANLPPVHMCQVMKAVHSPVVLHSRCLMVNIWGAGQRGLSAQQALQSKQFVHTLIQRQYMLAGTQKGACNIMLQQLQSAAKKRVKMRLVRCAGDNGRLSNGSKCCATPPKDALVFVACTQRAAINNV